MFFRNQTNNNNPSVNTRLAQFYSQENAVTLSAWNTNISLRIQPCIGVDGNGIRQYDNSRDKAITTSITPDNALALVKGVTEKILPAIQEGTPKRISVIISANSAARKVLTIGFDGKDSYMELAMNVSETGVCASQSVIRHTFSTRDYMEDYEPTNGTGNTITFHAELIRFIDKFKNIDLIGGAVPHAIKYADAARLVFVAGSSQFNVTPTTSNNAEPVEQKAPYSAPVQNHDGDIDDLLPFD